jgi:DNA replication initiation complex subunit (GINS family)
MEGQVTYEQLFDILRREKSRDELQKLDGAFYDHVRAFLAGKEDVLRQEQPRGSALAVQRAQIEYQNVRKILRELYDRRERKIVTMALHRTRTDSQLVGNDALLPEEKLFIEQLVHLFVQTREHVLSSIEMRAPVVVTPMSSYGAQSYAQQMYRGETPTRDDEDDVRTPEKGVPSFVRSATAAQASATVASSSSSQPRTISSADIDDSAPGDTFTTEELLVSVHFLAPVPKFVGRDARVFGPFEQGQNAKLPDEIAQILIKKGRAQEMEP